MKNNQFYPTPWGIAERAAALFKGPGGLLLEPSAGHGDLLKHLKYDRRDGGRNTQHNVKGELTNEKN